MRKHRKKIIIILAIVFFALLSGYIYLDCLAILPVKSSANTLTLAEYGHIGPRRIILKYYVNDVHICDYTLNLKVELRNQSVQKYKMPKFDKGRVDVYIELDRDEGCINARFEDAKDLFKNGLLIYIKSSYYSIDSYVYCISGKDKLYYHRREGIFDWEPTTDTSALKKFLKQEMGYVPGNYGWKEENKWVKTKP